MKHLPEVAERERTRDLLEWIRDHGDTYGHTHPTGDRPLAAAVYYDTKKDGPGYIKIKEFATKFLFDGIKEFCEAFFPKGSWEVYSANSNLRGWRKNVGTAIRIRYR